MITKSAVDAVLESVISCIFPLGFALASALAWIAAFRVWRNGKPKNFEDARAFSNYVVFATGMAVCCFLTILALWYSGLPTGIAGLDRR